MRRLAAFFCILFLFVSALAAGSFVIEGYTFNISGKTKEGAVKSLLVGDGEERFSSREDLVKALDDKVQTLNNLRVFKNVTYSLSERTSDDTVFVSVTFDIEDAKTFLILPYPKYDTNVGTIIGVKIYETNLLGNFADLASTLRVVFPAESWGKPTYDGTVKLTDLRLGGAYLSTDFTGDTSDMTFTYNLSVRDIPLGKTLKLDTGFSIGRKSEKLKYAASLSMKNIAFGSVGFVPSIDTLFHYIRSSSYIMPEIKTTGIAAGSLRIDFDDSFRFIDISEGDDLYSFGPGDVSHTTVFSFTDGALEPYKLSNTFKYTFDDRYAAAWNRYGKSRYDIDTTFSVKLSEDSTIMFMENIRLLSDSSVSRFDTGVGISQQIRIGKSISIRPTFSEFLRIEKSADGSVAFKRYYVMSAETSGNYINWKDNFRDGISYSIKVKESWIQQYSTRVINEETGINDHIEIAVHKVLWGWFNPSFRVTCNYVSDWENYGSIKGDDNYSLGEYLRGIRNSTTAGYDNNILAITANINLMSMFPLPSFMSFMNAYVNLFVDYGIAKPVGTDAHDFCGFGIEGIGILKSYPSYPIRASLGFDLEKLIKKCRGEEGSAGFYEIYIGLGFFF